MMRSLHVVMFIGLLAACSDNDAAPPRAAGDGAQAPVAEAVGGPGAELALSELDADDLDAPAEGELACSFTADDGTQPILIARGNVAPEERSFAIVKMGGAVEIFSSRTEGGYDAMVDGTGYGGPGLTLEIAHTGAETTPGEEGLSYPATLRAERADGARRSWTGVWSCGP